VNLGALVDAGERAIKLRGTVMLSLRGDERCWCAICVAVDGSVELRVGMPSRGWHRRRPADGEAWLRNHGFVHVIDAWAAPARGAGPQRCAELLSSALRDRLGAPDVELAEVLVHPGLIGDIDAPAPTAPHAENLRYTLRALANRQRGKVCIQGGRPAQCWAWVFAIDGTLALSPEPDDRADYRRDWTVAGRLRSGTRARSSDCCSET